MTSENILAFTRAEPFKPFRVTLADGSRFDIHWPDQCGTGSGRVCIPEACRVEGATRFGSVALLALENVRTLERLPDAPEADPVVVG